MYLALYFITLPLLLVIDLGWVAGVANSYYKSQLGPLLSGTPVWWAAALFYVLYVAGLVFFAIAPAVEARSLLRAVLLGAFFGLVAYGTYDLTNLATTSGWPTTMSFVDMAWGTVAGGGVSALVYLIATRVFGF
jgi:uncharacterized membrane protein